MKNTIAKKTEGYGYKYTELADINRYCLENEITYTQEVETCEINQKDYIVTYINQNGEITKHRGCQIVQAVLSGIKNPVQEYGSSLTYCRRYSLLMALGLATEDDDAQGLTEKKEATEEDAKKWIFTYGKYKDRTMDDIINEDLQYVEWYIRNKANDYDKKCYELLTGIVLPTEEELKARLEIMVEFKNLLSQTNTECEKLYEHYGVEKMDDLTNEQLKDAINVMKQKVK